MERVKPQSPKQSRLHINKTGLLTILLKQMKKRNSWNFYMTSVKAYQNQNKPLEDPDCHFKIWFSMLLSRSTLLSLVDALPVTFKMLMLKVLSLKFPISTLYLTTWNYLL